MNKKRNRVIGFNGLLYKQFFKVDKNDVYCNVPPSIIIKVLRKYIPQILPHIIKERSDLLFKYTKKAGVGECIETLMIEVFLFSK
jgi:hypothetical protein